MNPFILSKCGAHPSKVFVRFWIKHDLKGLRVSFRQILSSWKIYGYQSSTGWFMRENSPTSVFITYESTYGGAHIEKGRTRFGLLLRIKYYFECINTNGRSTIPLHYKDKAYCAFFVLFRALIERRAPHQRLSCDCAFLEAFFRFVSRSLSNINYCLYWLLKVRLWTWSIDFRSLSEHFESALSWLRHDSLRINAIL